MKVVFPLSEEVEFWLCAYPSFVRLILLALCLASKCRGCVVFERGVVYSRLLYCPKSSVEVPCVGVLCGQVSENPSA